MSIEMLKILSRQPLPRSFLVQEDIDRILLCKEAGLVEAYIPPANAGPARVIRIKPEGNQMLANYLRQEIRESGYGSLA